MSTRISYEDVQTSAIQLIQCAANILSVRYSLMNQMNCLNLACQWSITTTNKCIMDSDFSKASMLPNDYDTDLQSEWSNPSINIYIDD
jgi:hypothetical protein